MFTQAQRRRTKHAARSRLLRAIVCSIAIAACGGATLVSPAQATIAQKEWTIFEGGAASPGGVDSPIEIHIQSGGDVDASVLVASQTLDRVEVTGRDSGAVVIRSESGVRGLVDAINAALGVSPSTGEPGGGSVAVRVPPPVKLSICSVPSLGNVTSTSSAAERANAAEALWWNALEHGGPTLSDTPGSLVRVTFGDGGTEDYEYTSLPFGRRLVHGHNLVKGSGTSSCPKATASSAAGSGGGGAPGRTGTTRQAAY